MALFKSGNPTLTDKLFSGAMPVSQTETMTERGTMYKFGMMMLLLLAAASFTWKGAAEGKEIGAWIFGSLIIGAILAFVIIFKKQWASFLAPLYALAEGVFLGGISAFYNHAFDKIAPGIVMQAVGLTFGVVIAMFALYQFGVIKATQRFKSIVFTATAGIALFYALSFVLGFFGVSMPLIHEGSTWGIIFSLVVVGVAAMNLIIDFDMIEQGAKRGAPKFMEWYCAFGLMVTIIWLYLEILRLLSKMAGRK
jgi:uncharacterized YccA/Bax inhibitor family protein